MSSFKRLFVAALAASAAAQTSGVGSLADASLEDLLRVEVTSVSRRPQPLSRSAAAVYVITQEDIRRSGASSVPELLRVVPGLYVARINSSTWAVSTRGMASKFANKMLVLIDGRSIYTNLYSGVFWDQNDVLLQDIERIEIVRGPGGTMWGANAVNGVINIIMKPAAGTQGMLVSTRTGNEDWSLGALRWGGRLGKTMHYRLSGKYASRSGMRTARGTASGDEWSQGRGGARLDWNPTRQDALSIQGDLYQGKVEEDVYPGYPFDLKRFVAAEAIQSGGYAMGRWERTVSGRSELAGQISVQAENRNEAVTDSRSRQMDVDFQHRWAPGSRHDLLWGVGYRLTADRVGAGSLLPSLVSPQSRTQSVYSAFLQDEIALVPDRFVLSAGSKVQHNEFTGVEFQPGVRFMWLPSRRHTIWGAVARAVRTPSRAEHDMRVVFSLPVGPPGSLSILTSQQGVRSEKLVSHEAGWRWQPAGRISLDVAGFYSKYRDLISMQMGPMSQLSPSSPALLLPLNLGNALDLSTAGIELAAGGRLHRSLNLHGSYSRLSRLRREMRTAWTLFGPTSDMPGNMIKLGADWDIGRRLRANLDVYHMPRMRNPEAAGGLRADLRVAFRIGEGAEWSCGLQNALDDRHPEFAESGYVRATETKRSYYVGMTWGR